jgi:hypothetical protein
MTAHQMEGEHPHMRVSAHAEPAADLDESQPQGIEAHTRNPGLDPEPTKHVEQPIGGSMQQAELVGPEVMAAEADVKAGVFEVLDPELRLAAAPLLDPGGEGRR